MALRLYNTLTRTKEDFVPIDPSNVRMYVCGPTVYDFAHIGNARPLIVFDVLFRLLRHVYGPDHVTYVRNITDVDDKINARALRDFGAEIASGMLSLNDAIRRVTEATANQFHADVAALGCLTPTFEPRATEFVLPRADGRADMITLIARLIERGHAYQAGGEVLFDIGSMPDYGQLSRRHLDEQQAGARVEVDLHKKNAGDFVLWKLSSPDEPGWESPWGRGRPGWHIECSAMSAAYLGEVFDIHGGGLDLIFPHHENEIAQSRCAHGTAVMAKTWMHNGFLQVEGEKMSKSLGNFVTIRELLDDWPGEVIRLNMLKTHYRQPIDWTLASLEDSFDAFFELMNVAEEYMPTEIDGEFLAALSDDLNTPQALTRLYKLRNDATRGDIDAGAALTASLHHLGLGSEVRESVLVMPTLSLGATEVVVLDALMEVFPKNYPLGEAKKMLRRSRMQNLQSEVGLLFDVLASAAPTMRTGDVQKRANEIWQINTGIAARAAARKVKDFAKADEIRAELDAMGIALKDAKDPATGELVTTWEVKR